MIVGRLSFAGEMDFNFKSVEVGKTTQRENLPYSNRHVKGQEL